MKQLIVPCVRGLIGNRVYYSSIMNASQIAERLLPEKQIREAKSLEDFLQRKLHPRCKQIAAYLQKRSDRFFNSMIVGVFGGLPRWIPFDMQKTISELRLNSEIITGDTMGILVFGEHDKMFAIDGQHRVEGIKIAHAQNPESIVDDEYSVIFIAHIDDKLGKVNTRRLFSDINKKAVPVSKGDKVVIDEDELEAVVARRLFADYKPFKRGKIIANTEREQLPEGDVTHFTNLLTLYSVNKKLRKLFRVRRGTLEYSKENVQKFYNIVCDFYDCVFEHEKTYKAYFCENSTTLKSERRQNRNLLFRPAGLLVLAQLYAHCVKKKLLDYFKRGIAAVPFRSPGGVFDGVLWRNGKVGPRTSDRTAAVMLCAYHFGFDIEAPVALQSRLREVLSDSDYSLPHRIVQGSK